MNVRVAVVTGGASGMGRLFALRMAAQGIQVAVVDRDREALAAVSSESSNVHPVPCDVSSSDELGTAFTEIGSKLGAIDRLVTCAAIMPTSKLAEQEMLEIQRVMAVNYGGTVNAVQAVLPAMTRRR
ncbi:MAG: SDR family NAD(P)-dependent oxidoreductase, partial [Deltaproteobacteria bacterium]|nr:SDR family NAD(P)-dependent oxidoreductase [Deltaproteobacteria bacterium]